MGLISLEHGRFAYRVDMAIYSAAVGLISLWLMLSLHPTPWWRLLALASAGWGSWTLIEYLMHRFVLHGVRPFSLWHAQHHARPRALICTPTLVSGTLLLCLVYLPARLLFSAWDAAAWTWGVLLGYLLYTVTHHAVHHWRADKVWLLEKKRWHARHHHHERPVCFGVTTSLWDWVFGTA